MFNNKQIANSLSSNASVIEDLVKEVKGINYEMRRLMNVLSVQHRELIKEIEELNGEVRRSGRN